MGYIKEFCEELIKHSVAKNYDEAITEWTYHGEAENTPSFCICGHPITDNRFVHNYLNEQILTIGNCCIKKFGIKRNHWNKSRHAYLKYASTKTTDNYTKEFIERLQGKLEIHNNLRMTEKQKSFLETVTGKPYQWNYQR